MQRSYTKWLVIKAHNATESLLLIETYCSATKVSRSKIISYV